MNFINTQLITLFDLFSIFYTSNSYLLVLKLNYNLKSSIFLKIWVPNICSYDSVSTNWWTNSWMLKRQCSLNRTKFPIIPCYFYIQTNSLSRNVDITIRSTNLMVMMCWIWTIESLIWTVRTGIWWAWIMNVWWNFILVIWVAIV